MASQRRQSGPGCQVRTGGAHSSEKGMSQGTVNLAEKLSRISGAWPFQ